MHFGIEINKLLKFLTHKFLCLKISDFSKIFPINLWVSKTQKLMSVRNFKSLLISIPKCIELNTELILVLSLGLGPHPGPRPNIYFFLGWNVWLRVIYALSSYFVISLFILTDFNYNLYNYIMLWSFIIVFSYFYLMHFSDVLLWTH